MELEDGYILPSFLRPSTSDSADVTAYDDLSNVSLRTGLVLKSYPVTSPSNANKVYTEYDVQVVQADGLGQPNNRIYRHVIVGSLFGGVADYFRWTPRIEVYDPKSKINYGSRVLLLCLNGNSQKSYIIGGLPHPNGAPDTDYTEHDCLFEYNGLKAHINKDGELILTHKGATKADGKAIDAKNGNATVSMTKDGQIQIGYTASEGNKPQITWDKVSNTITIHGDSKIRIESENGPVEISTGNGVKINDATESFVRGTTYRQKEALFHQNMSQLFQLLSSLSTSAGSALTANSPTAAGPIVSSMGQVFSQLQAAIKAFENSSEEYLSKKHFHDD